MKYEKLRKYGLKDEMIKEESEGTLGRVICQYSNLYRVLTEDREILCEVSGKFRYNEKEYPAVGDFVIIKGEDRGIIHKVLERKNFLWRKNGDRIQGIGSNIDISFICTSLNKDFSINRLERYVSLCYDNLITPVIVLTKCDLCDDVEGKVLEVNGSILGVDVITVSMGDYDAILKYLKDGVTVSFIGSSGVGKSTMINFLTGNNVETKEVREKDDKGRHTTTRREILLSNYGGALIDTPGMRGISVETVDTSKSFNDIEELSKYCKFSDCTNESEPGCYIKKMVEEGSLLKRRFENYKKLKIESGYEGLTHRELEQKKVERMFKDIGGMKNSRRFMKGKK